jgi:hypothetical protein
MSPHQTVADSHASTGSGPRHPSLPSRHSPDAQAGVVRSFAALPAGVLAVQVAPATHFGGRRVQAFSRQASGREAPGRPYVQRHEAIEGWTVDLRHVFADASTLWYVLGIGTNALATNVLVGGFERAVNEELACEEEGVLPTAAQTDALIFPSLTPGLQPAHGRLLVSRDGRVLFETRDNHSVHEALQARTLYLPDPTEPEHHPPVDLPPDRPFPLQSGSALVPGAGLEAGGADDGRAILRIAWKPFDFSDRHPHEARGASGQAGPREAARPRRG